MKIRPAILWLSIGILALLLLLWLSKRPAKIAFFENAKAPSSARQVPVQTTNAPASGNRTNLPNGTAPSMTFRQKLQSETPQERWATISEQINRPLLFYGKLEDQFGNPVSDAQVTGFVTVWDGYAGQHSKFTTTSDTSGFFKLDPGKGQMLGIMPHKIGYALASMAGRIDNSSGEEKPPADPNSPVVIEMWKLQGAEPLLKFNQRYKLPFTPTPINIDLLTGKVVPSGGDIRLTVSRSPGIVSERTLQDWGIKIEAVDGGLMDSDGQERIIYWAPESGYQAEYEFTFSTKPQYGWNGGFTKGFFIKSRNGQVYSKLGISFAINQTPDEPMDISFSGIANTNGSRNWEGDPNTSRQ